MSNLTVRDCVSDGPKGQNGAKSPIIVRPGAQVSLRSVSFMNNNNTRGPAAIYAEANCRVDIRDSYFAGNSGRPASVLRAGARCEVIISNSTFERNRGRGGIAVLVDSNRLEVSGSNFTENVATHRNGGAIHVKVCFVCPTRSSLRAVR